MSQGRHTKLYNDVKHGIVHRYKTCICLLKDLPCRPINSLLCYTREATGREEANNEDIAYSMHLALRSGDDAEWQPLNENYGIFFAAGVPIAAATAESRRACTPRRASPPTRSTRLAPPPTRRPWRGHARYGYHAEITQNPFLFRLADGRFAIAATRTARGGEPDGSERSAFLLAISMI